MRGFRGSLLLRTQTARWLLALGMLVSAGGVWLGETQVARGQGRSDPLSGRPVATGAPPPYVAQQAGVVPSTLMGMYGGYQDDAAMTRVRQSGAQLMRVYAEWASLQPYQAYGEGGWLEPTTRAQLDAQLRRIAEAGLTAVVLVGEAPDWVAPRPRGPLAADKLPHYVRLMEMLVRAYKDPPYNVRYWELWPEPDAADSIPPALVARYGTDILKRRAWGSDGGAYATMLKATYPAMKRADPGATVLIGAIAYDWFGDNCPGFNCGGIFNYRFLDDVVAAGGGCCFDILAFNDYAPFAPGWEGRAPGRDIVAKTNYLRQRLESMGVSKPMMVLEAGLWSSGGDSPTRLADGRIVVPPPSAERQAQYVTKLYTRAASLGLLTVSWYTFRDQGYDSDKRGIVGEALEAKAAFWAYRVVADRLRGAFFGGLVPKFPVPGGGELEGYQFVTPDARNVTIVWLDGVQEGSFELTVDVQSHVAKVLVYDSIGRVRNVLRPQRGRVTVQVTTSPVYVEEIVPSDVQLSLPIIAKGVPGR